MFRKQAVPIADLLNAFLRNNGLETPLMEKRLLDAYDAVMGKTIANLTGEKYIKNQTLFVKIKRPALRNDLMMMRREITQKLNSAVGSHDIADIKFF